MKNYESSRQAVRRLLDRCAEALTAEDCQYPASVWDEHAVHLPPGAPALFGSETISEYLTRLAREGRWKVAVCTEDVRLAGELAVAWGTFVASVVPEGGGGTEYFDCKFLVLCRRQENGRWSILRSCYNSN